MEINPSFTSFIKTLATATLVPSLSFAFLASQYAPLAVPFTNWLLLLLFPVSLSPAWVVTTAAS